MHNLDLYKTYVRGLQALFCTVEMLEQKASQGGFCETGEVSETVLTGFKIEPPLVVLIVSL